MRYLFIILLLISPLTSYAGVDFSMSGGEFEVPKFSSRSEAIKYANKVKWIEPVLYKFKEHFYHLQNWHMNYRADPGHYPVIAEYVEEQLTYLHLAIGIMENFKKHNVQGDAAQVGSTVYAGSVPI